MRDRPRATLAPPRRRHHRQRRRLHPARVLRCFVEIPEEERLEEYRHRWRTFEAACEASGWVLTRTVEALALAEARLLGFDPPALAVAEPAERAALALAERLVARYWRGRPCPAFGGCRLPKIATGPYFNTGSDTVHWLDVDSELVREALGHELADLERRMIARRHDNESLTPVLLDDVRNRLIADPVRSMSSPLVQRVRERLTSLAHHAASLETRRRAARWLERLDQAIRPDFRARVHRRRPRHGRSSARGRALLGLVAAVREEQNTFRVWCAEQDQASLPPPFKSAVNGLQASSTRGIRVPTSAQPSHPGTSSEGGEPGCPQPLSRRRLASP